MELAQRARQQCHRSGGKPENLGPLIYDSTSLLEFSVNQNDSTCVLCGAKAQKSIAERGALHIDSCSMCGIFRGYDKLSDTADAGAVTTDPNHFGMLIEREDELRRVVGRLFAKRLPHIERMLGRPPENWLEIGPGNGVLSDIVSQRGGFWLGVEIENDMASRMQLAGKNIINADFSNVSVDAIVPSEVAGHGGFDIAFFSQVFEHVTAPAAFLRNIFSSLRPGGVVYLDVPNNRGLTAWLRTLNPMAHGYGEIVPPHHMIAYGSRTLSFALRQAGFENIRTIVRPYDHSTFGLAHAHLQSDPKLKAIWLLSRLIGMGGNLIGMARKP
jgi:2-polyprenyl-3-methyl-5-hydroxy-6-metoxy-1,4-benzoquinol methylase